MGTNKVKKVRLRLESFHYPLIAVSCKNVIHTLNQYSSVAVTRIPLPTFKRIYCVLRSPHVDKDSREHFEIRIYFHLLEIYYEPELFNIFDLLEEINISSGVYCRIDMS